MFFEDFFNGRMPGNNRTSQRENIDNKGLYKTLGVEKNADSRTLKKAWRKLCRTHHPDRGGDTEKFKECEQAYEILSDPAKRELYNEGGIEAVQRGASAPTDIFDLFGGQGKRHQKGPSKPQPIKVC
jgi:DnaJ family protein A protein 2